MKTSKYVKVISFVLLLVSVSSFGQKAQNEPPLPDGRRLKQIVSEKFSSGNVYIGGTTGWKKRSRGAGQILDREFSYTTPENDFKQWAIHPQPNVWKWKDADAWVEHCEKNGQILRLHGPIGPQCSNWAKQDHRTAKELRKHLVEFMIALCQRYDRYDHVKWMDVVNETVLANGKWHQPKKGTEKWENPWFLIGSDTDHPLNPPLYIELAFELANQYAPNTELIINQHGSMQKPMWDKIKRLVLYLRKKGLRVDGIGWQAHVNVGWEKKDDNMNRLSQLIDWAHQNELSFHITENNVWLPEKKNYQAQAKTFSTILRLLLKKRDSGVVTWNVWNLSDADAWKKKEKLEGCLFDRQYRAKPAYYALQKLLENPPTTMMDAPAP